MLILDEVNNVEMLFSSANQSVYDLAFKDKSDENLTVKVSPVMILVSNHRVEYISRLIKAINSFVSIDGNQKLSEHEKSLTRPRLLELAHVYKRKISLLCSSFELILSVDSNNNMYDRYDIDTNIILKEILTTYLSQSTALAQTSGCEKCEAQNILFQICYNWINRLGFTESKAKSIIEMVNVEFNAMNMTDYVRPLRSSDPKGSLKSVERDVLIIHAIDNTICSLSKDFECIPTVRSGVLLSISCGFKLYFDQLFYDYRLSLHFSTLTVCNVIVRE
jgi:hypothetical protein